MQELQSSFKALINHHIEKMKFYDDITQLIGRTPLVKIKRINPYPEVTVLAKLERFNPSGSVKDRIALHMIEEAERSGLLSPDKTIIEATSGNTGIGLAMISALKGYNTKLVMPESMSFERIKIMESYGASVILTPEELGIDGARAYVERMISQEPDKYFNPNQYNNAANWRAHYETTAQEILEDTDRQITHFVAGLGTSGTLMGVARRLKEELDGVKIISAEPTNGAFIQGLKNLYEDAIPCIFNQSYLDERYFVTEQDARKLSLLLSEVEGLFTGHSAGAAMWAALEVARDVFQRKIKNAVIVVLFADSGEKYLN